MPLDTPALALGPGPRGVQDARRWVRGACVEIGRPELVECAQLGVSELVTNALLHGLPPIRLRLRGTHEHPRVEVHDTSSEAPTVPEAGPVPDDDLGDLLTFGRGLGIVSRAASAWGADVAPDGKVVWFVPAADFAVDGVAGRLTDSSVHPAPTEVVDDPVTVRVLDVPLEACAVFDRHLRELRREVRLLALAHESAYPLAQDLYDLFGSLERHLSAVMGTGALDRAAAQGRIMTDLEVVMARSAARGLSRFTELLDLADEFCREERLLSLARSPEQRRFQSWFLGEFVDQGEGHEPVPWTELRSSRHASVS